MMLDRFDFGSYLVVGYICLYVMCGCRLGWFVCYMGL